MKTNKQRIEDLENRLLELEVFKYEALEMFHSIGRVFSLNLELAKRKSSTPNNDE